MEKELKELLLSFDDEEECESSQNFNYLNEMEKVYIIKNKIENIISNELIIDEWVQDASFFTELSILEKSQNKRKNNGESFVYLYELSIRFSSFGNMVTIFNNTENNVLSKYPIKEIINMLQSNGYIYINSDSLDEPYDGINKYISNKDTWWTRYFDYI